MTTPGDFNPLVGYKVNSDTDKSRRDHLYSDVDSGEDAQHHTIGEAPDQAVSLPRAQRKFDSRYAFDQHSHPEISGDNLVTVGDAAVVGALTGWTIVENPASPTESQGSYFTTQFSATACAVAWKSNAFTPVQGEVMTGNLIYRADKLDLRARVYVIWSATAGNALSFTLSTAGVVTAGSGNFVELRGTKTVTAINTDSLWDFSWTVPETAVTAAVIIVWDTNTVASGFPVNASFDDVRLISNLTTPSTLYVGVAGSQTMEGPLAISGGLTAGSVASSGGTFSVAEIQELTLPVGAGDGLVLTSDADGLASWEALNLSIPISNDGTPPGGIGAGDLWIDKIKLSPEPMYFSIDGPNTQRALALGTVYTAVSEFGTLRINIPCDGVLEVDFNCWTGWASAPTVGARSQGYIEYVYSGSATLTASALEWWVFFAAVAQANYWNRAMVKRIFRFVGVPADGVVIDLKIYAYGSTSNAVAFYPRYTGKFFPYASYVDLGTM